MRRRKRKQDTSQGPATGPTDRRHSFWARVKTLFGIPYQRGGADWVYIGHDDDCPFFEGGVCNCDPDVIPLIVWRHGLN